MREQYPFFRDADERTLAVIGEEAVDSDLNGTYQKPYAVLSDRRLYCKNEGGNFITEAKALKSAKKARLPGQNWFLWGAAGCVLLSLALLCLWYWGWGGRWHIEGISYSTQGYIDRYHATEERVSEYEQTIQDYEEAQKAVEQLEQELDETDVDQFRQEVDQRYREAEQLWTALNQAAAARDEQSNLVSNARRRLSEYSKELADAERKIESTDPEANAEILSQIESLQDTLSYWRIWRNASDADFSPFWGKKTIGNTPYTSYTITVWRFDGQEFEYIDQIRTYCGNKMTEVQNQISTLWENYVDVESLQYTIEWAQRMYYQVEADLEGYQQQLDETQAAVDAAQKEYDDFQTAIAAAEAKVSEAEAFRANIEQKQYDLNGQSYTYSRAQSALQWLEDSKPAYQNAQSVQRAVKLVVPCLAVLAVCVTAVIILTVLKRTKAAVIATLASACAGLVCAFLVSSCTFVDNISYYYGEPMKSWMAIALRILFVLSVLLGLIALVWNRKRAVFQITHTTGSFHFTPSLYPTAEFKNFTAQVEGLKTGEKAHA